MTDTAEMVDEVNGNDTKPEEAKPANEGLAEELKSRDAIITRLEQEIASKDNEAMTLKQALSEAEKKLGEINTALAQAVASYKALVIQSNPGVLAELITGNTVDEVNGSLKNALAIIDRVRQEIEAEDSRTRVPAGAPQRSPLDLSTLTPREKIQYAIGGKK